MMPGSQFGLKANRFVLGIRLVVGPFDYVDSVICDDSIVSTDTVDFTDSNGYFS